MRLKLTVTVLSVVCTVLCSSCSGSSVQQPQVLPQVGQSRSITQAGTTPNVTIIEYDTLPSPPSPGQAAIIGPDGAAWLPLERGVTNNGPLAPLYVYRFAANDGQGRFYALPSVLKAADPTMGEWHQSGPLVSFAGYLWLAFVAKPLPNPGDNTPVTGFVRMTAAGVAKDAVELYRYQGIASAAVDGTRLWIASGGGENPVITVSTLQSNRLTRVATIALDRFLFARNIIRRGLDGNMYEVAVSDLYTMDAYVYKISASPPFAIRAKYFLGHYVGVNDMAVAGDGALWITTSNHGVIRMATNGSRSIIKGGDLGQPTAITAGPDGAMWVTDSSRNAICRVLQTGFDTCYPIPTPRVDSFGIVACPRGVLPCGSGDLWFNEYDGMRIYKLGRVHFQ